jgi:hypothetical protein
MQIRRDGRKAAARTWESLDHPAFHAAPGSEPTRVGEPSDWSVTPTCGGGDARFRRTLPPARTFDIVQCAVRHLGVAIANVLQLGIP